MKRIPAPGVHGVIAVGDHVYASATNARQVYTIDARTLKVTAKAPAGEYPDGLAYDPVEQHVFVSDESGGVETVLDARGHRVTEIPLGGEAGNVQYDAGSHRILVGVQSRNEVAVINPRSNEIVRRVAVPGCDGSHGLLVDSPRRLAFVACEGNAKLATIDLRTMKVTGLADVGDGPDVLAFDKGLRRLYVAAESGEVAVFAERGRSCGSSGRRTSRSRAHGRRRPDDAPRLLPARTRTRRTARVANHEADRVGTPRGAESGQCCTHRVRRTPRRRSQ